MGAVAEVPGSPCCSQWVFSRYQSDDRPTLVPLRVGPRVGRGFFSGKRSHPGELRLVQCGVDSVEGHELFVVTHLLYASFLQDNYEVGVLNSR